MTEARIHSDVYSNYYIFCHGKNVFVMALQYYVIPALPVISYWNFILTYVCLIYAYLFRKISGA